MLYHVSTKHTQSCTATSLTLCSRRHRRCQRQWRGLTTIGLGPKYVTKYKGERSGLILYSEPAHILPCSYELRPSACTRCHSSLFNTHFSTSFTSKIVQEAYRSWSTLLKNPHTTSRTSAKLHLLLDYPFRSNSSSDSTMSPSRFKILQSPMK